MKKRIVVYFCLIVCSIVFGQEYNFTNYTNKDGLPSNEVFGIAIDKKGYLWICTDKGIAKFDGDNFVNYTSLNGLNDNVFFNITQDYKDRIWLWSYNFKFNYILNGKIYDYKFNDKIKKRTKLQNNLYCTIVGVGKDDTMFFNINSQNLSIDRKGNVEYYDQIVFGNNIIISLKNGKLTNEGIVDFPLDLIKNEDWFLKKDNEKKYNYINLYSEGDDYYFYRKNELFAFHNSVKTFKEFDGFIQSFCVDNKQRIWVSLGLEKVAIYQNLNSPPEHTLNHFFGNLIKDATGNIWISDAYRGLYKFPNSFVVKYDFAESNIISSLLPYQSYFNLFSYDNKLYQYNYSQKKVSKIANRFAPFKKFVHSMNDIDFNGDKVEFYGAYSISTKESQDSIVQIKAIQKSKDKFILASNYFFYIYDTNAQMFTKIVTQLNRLKDLYYLDDETIFLATIDGVYTMNLTNKSTIPIDQKQYRNEHTQVIKRIDNYLLLGTKGKGIAVYSLKDKKITAHYNLENSGMPNSINAMYIKRNDVWIGTNKGIYWYTFANGNLFFKDIININNGLSLDDILGLYCKDHYLYCIMQNQLNVIDLNNRDLFKNPKPNIPEIELVKINKRVVGSLTSITTDYNQNDIEIRFNTAYLLDKSRITYLYQLLNYDNKWYQTKNNLVNYNNLPPGNYQFMIKTIFDNGKMSSELQRFNITVTQPYWMKQSFKIIASFLILVLSFGLLLLYFYRKSKNVKKKMQVIEYQQQALRAQIKPHFIFNALNSIQYFVLQNNMHHALDFIEKFSQLTRSILDISEYEYTTLADELMVIQHYLDIEKIRFSHFNYQIVVEPNIDINETLVPSLLLQPIVENAIWHGLQKKTVDNLGSIKLGVKSNDQRLIITIEDDGVGRVAASTSKHNSKGLSMLKKRLSLLKLKKVNFEFIDLYDQNQPSGTRVVLTIPLLKK